MTSWSQLVEGIAVLAAVAVSLYTLRASRRKTAAEAEASEASAADRVTGAALTLLEPMRARIEQLEQKVQRLEIALAQARKDETFYQAELHGKELEIQTLQARVAVLEGRL